MDRLIAALLQLVPVSLRRFEVDQAQRRLHEVAAAVAPAIIHARGYRDERHYRHEVAAEAYRLAEAFEDERKKREPDDLPPGSDILSQVMVAVCDAHDDAFDEPAVCA